MLAYSDILKIKALWILNLAVAVLLTSTIHKSYAQENKNQYDPEKHFKVVFYNVENLFDVEDDPVKNDNEFLPDGAKKWTADRYKKKLNDLAKVLRAVGDQEFPDLIGLCEVENRRVLEDLVTSLTENEEQYRIVHEESPDMRGIDVAMIYDPGEFMYITHDVINIKYPMDPGYKTRDVLYVKGLVMGVDTLHVFVNHWKSRWGGTKETEPKRLNAANTVRKKVDAIFAKDKHAKIIIIGDLNDNPTDKSVLEVLRAGNDQNFTGNDGLYNLMHDKYANQGLGTYSYRGTWNMLDQIIVSYPLLRSNKGLFLSFEDGRIFKPEWILHHNERFDSYSPNRTFGGNNYYGGYSDHLPVYTVIKISE